MYVPNDDWRRQAAKSLIVLQSILLSLIPREISYPEFPKSLLYRGDAECSTIACPIKKLFYNAYAVHSSYFLIYL